MLLLKPLFTKGNLSSNKILSPRFPLFLYSMNFTGMYYSENKGIRVEVADVAPATKGALENKGFLILR